MLSIQLPACTQMLLLSGSTNCTRPWCGWELFTLTAFISVEVAMEKLVVRLSMHQARRSRLASFSRSTLWTSVTPSIRKTSFA